MADPSGSIPSSSAARAWNSRVYSTTGGQTVATRGSETPVAQPLRFHVGMWSMIGRGIDVKGRWNLWWGYRWFWIALAAILVVVLLS